MKVAITGSRGLIGSSLVPHLRAGGHQVVRIVREKASDDEILWNPQERSIDTGLLEGVEAVVHLAGAGVGDRRWSESYKQTILSSRVDGTTTLAQAVSRLARPPAVMVSASAVGYYGSRGDEILTEKSESGRGFLADVCRQWEAATSAASAAGIRVVHLRTGVVLSAAGGALKKQLLPFRLGLGARLGRGKQQLSWITRRDAVAGISFLLQDDQASGPFNLTSPDPVSNSTFTRALARAVKRPALLAVPAAVLRLVVGEEMTSEFLVASQRVLPERLLAAGFTFADATVPEALAMALQDREADH
jgi:uncharacterized protein (TIGR01777 family)